MNVDIGFSECSVKIDSHKITVRHFLSIRMEMMASKLPNELGLHIVGSDQLDSSNPASF